ncbi:hypothetical protein ACHAXS_013445 [Conticribra weissflogii]
MADDAEKAARREKHKKRMNKILFKCWNLPDAEPFQDSSHPSTHEVRDLTSVGQNLDKGVYQHGRSGWELYAKDMGIVYNWHISRRGKHSTRAKAHLDKVVGFFSKVDPILGELVSKSKPSEDSSDGGGKNQTSSGKKRKNSEKDNTNSSPRKKNNVSSTERLTLSQREKRSMEMLATYLEECGGERSQSNNFRCMVVQRPGGRYESIFFSVENKRFKSMADVARFLNLVDDRPGSGGGSRNNSKSSNRGQKDSEKRKLKRELDKLMKLHTKAVKVLDDHCNENPVKQLPMNDVSMMDDGSNAAKAHREGRIVPSSDIEAFPGIPAHCIPDLFLVWDFLCTFCRALSLEPIELDDFAAALSFRPVNVPQASSHGDSASNIPVYLSESHIALLRLLLQDPTSDNWWWSILETPEMVEEEGEEYLNATDKKRKSAAAVVKIDMEALLAAEEDTVTTARWLLALEDVRTRKPDNTGPIKSAVRNAIAATTNQYVKSYLKKAMRKWNKKSAGLVKRAVVWLVDRVREARPDVWGRSVDVQEIAEQKKIVATEAAIEMDRIVEDADEVNDADLNLEVESDEESDFDEDEGSDNEDEYADQADNQGSPSKQLCSMTTKENDDITPVTTFVPAKPVPSLVDLLLPPGKPTLPSDLVHALTWPPVIGATSCRVLHWYKRRRNEVDDSIREFRELKPMSVAERRARESIATFRILSECANPRLCIFRILIEAAYDTYHVQQSIEDNFKARMNAIKALDAEERRAKKEAREELAAIEAAARERLSREAQETFVEKKRKEIIQNNEETGDYSAEFLEDLQDADIINFDEDTKAEYEALPTPDSFNKSEVNTIVAKIQEETAFGTSILVVLSLKEIEQREEKHLTSLQEKLESFGDLESLYQTHSADRETSAMVDKIRKEIATCIDLKQSLPQLRSNAIDALNDAIDDGTVKALRTAIKAAKVAKLTGDDVETGGIWSLDLLRDAALELKNAESRKRVTEAQKDLVAKRNKCFIRTDPLGSDRYQTCFVHFDYDKSSRVWAERDFIICKDSLDSKEDSAVLFKTPNLVSMGARDRDEDFLSLEDRDKPYGSSFLSFSRQEYHHTSEIATLAMHHWSCYTTDRSIRVLIKNLNSKNDKEKALKEVLKGTLEAMALASASSDAPPNGALLNGGSAEGTEQDKRSLPREETEFRSSGDSDVFTALKGNLSEDDAAILKGVTSAIGRRIRLRRIPNPERAPDVAQYIMGTITGWKTKIVPNEEAVNKEDFGNDKSHPPVPTPLWRMALDDGGELHITDNEVVEGLARATKWTNQHPGYIEHDAPFLSYRNNFGRFCGRQVDAPSSLTPLAFARQMLKKEQDLYMPLKNRTLENNWGGKCGSRNAWVASLKEYGHTFEAVRDGLLTLENAFFDLTGGFGTNGSSMHDDEAAEQTTESKLSGKDLLYDEVSRFDIELESLGNDVKGLWNNPDTRAIFREIISMSETVSILALGLDLICRNSQGYISRTKSSVVHQPAFEQAPSSVVGRRRAAMQRPGAYSDFF